ncbi:DEAD/DEAH box helicase, partial [Listeria grayi]|uniref:DEAD/DEAH box helicase n=1 Tax=Listeria grayi TaxID=1641 RepID=UPI00117B5F18
MSAWEKKRDQKDVVGILNTGAGKTLVGLLMLLSKMNEGIGPCIYLCPNKQLVEQVVKQASNHNIPVVKINEKNALPIEFLNSQSILITTFERLFNGKSIFGVAGYGDRDIES